MLTVQIPYSASISDGIAIDSEFAMCSAEYRPNASYNLGAVSEAGPGLSLPGSSELRWTVSCFPSN